jgi:hypothetical protein
MSAIRSMVALNQIASPAAARAMITFKPCSEVRPSRTNRSWAARAACCSAPTGSAWMMAASSRVCSRPHDTAPNDGASRSSTAAACAMVRCRVAVAMRRAWYADTRPAWAAAQMERSRCRRSNASPISRHADPSEMHSTHPSSAGARSPTVGVPSPPSWMGCSVPGSRLGTTASPGCRSAQCPAMWRRRVSAVIRVCSLASAAARVCAASNSTRSFSNTHSIYGLTPTLLTAFEHVATTGQHLTNPDNTGDSWCAGRRPVGSRRDGGLPRSSVDSFASAWFGWAQADSTHRTWLLVGSIGCSRSWL